jgi:hypothetical protein
VNTRLLTVVACDTDSLFHNELRWCISVKSRRTVVSNQCFSLARLNVCAGLGVSRLINLQVNDEEKRVP